MCVPALALAGAGVRGQGAQEAGKNGAAANDSPRATTNLFVVARPTLWPRSKTLTTLPHTPHFHQIHGPEELDAILSAYPERLVVLQCKAASCRPCKMFARKFSRLAASTPDAVFLVITGDESPESRAMMMAMKVRVTPTFFVYRGGVVAKTTTGVNENNLKAALDEAAAGDA